jgi:signal transduction histidine kinase
MSKNRHIVLGASVRRLAAKDQTTIPGIMPAISLPASTFLRRWIFLAFLAALHLVLWHGPTSQFGRLFFLVHIGIGLLWQPFIQSRRQFGFVGTALVVFCSTLLAYYLSWGLLIVWTMLLAGVVGGKVFLFPDRWERLFHLAGLGYLGVIVFALLLPQYLQTLRMTEPVLESLVLYSMPGLFVVMTMLPATRQVVRAEGTEIVDYVYGVMTFLLQAVIALGSISFSLLYKVGYFESLLVALALVAGILLALGLIWNPSSGFGGLGSAVAQHVMSLGLPIEEWIETLAVLGKDEENPEHFLALACAQLPERLPGVIGGCWESIDGHDEFGVREGHSVAFSYGRLKVELAARIEPSPTLLWHYDLAIRLLAEYYLGKWRAQELKRLSYIEAIHETGARLTHDVKNLLQTLDTLCMAAEKEGAMPSLRFNELLRRQLPEIALRLRQTLVKLSAPKMAESTTPMSAVVWLKRLEDRFAGSRVNIVASDDAEAVVVANPDLFSGVAENLLQNIADKRRIDPAIMAEVRLEVMNGRPVLSVFDTGKAIESEHMSNLFACRTASENGLGIGLYQSARLAESGCYRLGLAENRDGCVLFRLEPTD